MNITLDTFTKPFQHIDFTEYENYKFEIACASISIVALSTLAFFCIKKCSKPSQLEKDKFTTIGSKAHYAQILENKSSLQVTVTGNNQTIPLTFIKKVDAVIRTWTKKFIENLDAGENFIFKNTSELYLNDNYTFCLHTQKTKEKLKEKYRRETIERLQNISLFNIFGKKGTEKRKLTEKQHLRLFS